MKKLITITLALLILLSCIPLSVAAAPKELFDDCKSYDTLFEKSSNFDDRGGGWEYAEDGKSNRWNPHPTLGLTCFGKKAGYREWVTYKFEKTTSFELHFYCAYDDKGTYLIKPVYEYDDQPLLAGAIIEVSADNQTWTKIKLNEVEGKQAGNKDPSNGYYWVDYTVTPAEKLPENTSYFRITLGQTAGWSMFLGSVKLTDDPAAAPAAVVTTVPTAPPTEPTEDATSDTTAEAVGDTTGDDTTAPTAKITEPTAGTVEAEPNTEGGTLSAVILLLIIIPIVIVIAVVIIIIIVVVLKKKKASPPSGE